MGAKQEKFEGLVQAYSNDLYRYAYWLSSDRSVAEDLVQETYLRAWKALDSLLDAGAAKSWLFTIVRRENARRFERKSARTEHVSWEDTGLDNVIMAQEAFTDIDEMALRSALEALPKDYSEPLVLQVLGGYSCEEIGEILEIKPGAVMTRVFRARQKLRKYLSEDGDVRVAE